VSRRLVIAALALALAGVLAACGGGGGESADSIAQKAYAAVNRPGMVYHTTTDDGTELWLDTERHLFRREEPATSGKLVSVGDGWNATTFDSQTDSVSTRDRSPQGPAPRINDPVILWLEPLAALGYGQNVVVIGKTMADEQEVLALTAATPIVDANGQPTGAVLEGRVELDPDTYLPHAYEKRQSPPAGQAQTPAAAKRTVFKKSEFISRDKLAVSFFSTKDVEAQVQTIAQTLQRVIAMGLSPLWLGEQYQSDGGALALKEGTTPQIDPNTNEVTLNYALVVPVNGQNVFADDTIVVRLGPAGTNFGSPPIPQFSAQIPEQHTKATARGVPADVYVSFLSPADLGGCQQPPCLGADVSLYARIAFTVENTSVQIEATARVDATGMDQDGYNSAQGVIALANALQVGG
jgi:hypothetical protein